MHAEHAASLIYFLMRTQLSTDPVLDEVRGYPTMVHWFNPVLLGKLILNVIVADVFGQYADSRLIHAALDNTATVKDFEERADITSSMRPDDEGAVWVDFVADLGDGFDATYAVAYLLGQQELVVGGHELPRGSALVMGGDQVYPTSGYSEYIRKMRTPYAMAFPDRPGADHPPILLIPGNHDWYDGLVHFVALFCRKKPSRVGNWRTRQRRSYFAAKLTEDCWIWAIDIALTGNMDQPQADYFVAIAGMMPPGATIVFCAAEPGWYKAEKKADAYRVLSYAAWIAKNAGKSLRTPLVLSGDSHHYCRYSMESGTQFITSGGGGAFLHGTHQLKDEIKADWLEEEGATLSLKTTPDEQHGSCDKRACYPTQEKSKELLWGDLLFPFLNFDFALLLGFMYWAASYALILRFKWDIAAIIFGVLTLSLWAYSRYQEDPGRRVLLPAALHALVHVAAIALLAWSFIQIGHYRLGLLHWDWWAYLLALGVVAVPGGGFIAGLIFGSNLFLTCRFADMNHNDAFSAMRLDSFRHFLRVRITAETLTIYAIGIDKVPSRAEWRRNPDRDRHAPVLVPASEISTRLIEEPIVIRRGRTTNTEDMKAPPEETATPP